jgi:hypothetical protein
MLDFNVVPNFLKTLNEYKALVLKMHEDGATITQVAHNLELFSNLKIMLGLFVSCLKD